MDLFLANCLVRLSTSEAVYIQTATHGKTRLGNRLKLSKATTRVYAAGKSKKKSGSSLQSHTNDEKVAGKAVPTPLSG